MPVKQLIIQYKTKVKKMANGREYIDFKKTLDRKDTPLKPHEHTYYNSDLFPSIIRRAALKAQNNRAWCYVDELPAGISLDATGFLAVVTITC
ncbi:hypothetical protein [Geomonas subterranea]|uniref:hypothetical protein n=1 Tax=Geomonas subterranea TaxID=2847989 RepID=UPI001CD6E269|nr:hypothetical protein [Geomonas fuzhouensis]